MFRDFVNEDDSVCVTHRIICCGDTLETRKCVEFPTAAILGTPTEERRLTDIIPSGITVYQFIQDNMNLTNPDIPLLIDGTLILNIHNLFSNGTWNMGEQSKVLNIGVLNSMDQMLVQSPGRLNPAFPCCYWIGFESENTSRTVWKNSTISDAEFYLAFSGTYQFDQPSNCFSVKFDSHQLFWH